MGSKYFNTSKGKMFQYPHIVYYRRTLLQPLSKNRFYFFFLIFWHAKIHHLLGCHAIVINSSLIFFKGFPFFKFNIPKKKSDKDNSFRIIFIKIIIKINIIKIYVKNTLFIARKYDITRIFINLEYIFICVQSSKKFFNHFTRNKPIGNKFKYC